MKSKWTAFWLCFFLGGLGIHKFYLNKPWQGVFYILFVWTYVPALIAFVELFIIGFMDVEKFNLKYNHDKKS